jgi:ribosomal protein S19E (S16A)
MTQPTTKLTQPQKSFLRRLYGGKQSTVWPGVDRRIANNLKKLGLISIVSDLAMLTEAGHEAVERIIENAT